MFVSPRRNQSSSWMMDLSVNLLGREQRKAIGQRIARLRAEHGIRARAGAVGLELAVLQNVAEQIEILNHAGRN